MSGACIGLAAMAIKSGLAKTVALVLWEQRPLRRRKYGGENHSYGGGGLGPWFPYGMSSPGAAHAIMFQRHMHQYGTTSKQLAAIPVAFRKHAMLNPGAVMKSPIACRGSPRASRFIAEPLHLLELLPDR